jgi:hypothetical protein
MMYVCISGNAISSHFPPCLAKTCGLLYHFDRVFTISENLLSEKAEKFSFDLRRILKRSIFFGRDA